MLSWWDLNFIVGKCLASGHASSELFIVRCIGKTHFNCSCWLNWIKSKKWPETGHSFPLYTDCHHNVALCLNFLFRLYLIDCILELYEKKNRSFFPCAPFISCGFFAFVYLFLDHSNNTRKWYRKQASEVEPFLR